MESVKSFIFVVFGAVVLFLGITFILNLTRFSKIG